MSLQLLEISDGIGVGRLASHHASASSAHSEWQTWISTGGGKEGGKYYFQAGTSTCQRVGSIRGLANEANNLK